ncbi:geminin DNA replication inhibitor isoform X2 [Oratosquilla oratoria]|uniref:geminin DNA replication inhibitor isoform X2 n=1 Tax=Oratosquilla oratoria TaxID=337810 RepID=UPI003F765027
MSVTSENADILSKENDPSRKAKTPNVRKFGTRVAKQTQLLIGANGRVLVDSTNKKRKSEDIRSPAKNKRTDGIYEDPTPPAKKIKSFNEVAVQTDDQSDLPPESTSLSSDKESSTSKVVNMLTSGKFDIDVAPPEYWEGVAEKRRQALEKVLIENKDLHDENDRLKQRVNILTEENGLLQEMVDEAKELAELVQTVTEADE